MGYIEKVMGDNEQTVYRTHQHPIVLILEMLSSLFTFTVFLVMGLIVILSKPGEAGEQTRFYVGLITLGSILLPLYRIISVWWQGLRGGDFFRRIWRQALAAVLILTIALVIMLLHSRVTGWIMVAVSIYPAAEMGLIVLDWLNERYIITNRRVMEVKGIINKHIRDSALEKVNDVELDQSIVGRMLGYGTVQIITGSDIGVNMFRRISNPVRFKREMLNAKEGLQTAPQADHKIDPVTTAPLSESIAAGSSGTSSRIPELIAELDELRKRGIVSDEEFQIKKKELLDRL